MPEPPICPVCDQPATATSRRTHRHVVVANSICGAGHLWQTKWLRPVVLVDTRAS